MFSSFSSTLSLPKTSWNAGHPEPDSNFVSEENRAVPQTTQLYTPSSFHLTYLPEKGLDMNNENENN